MWPHREHQAHIRQFAGFAGREPAIPRLYWLFSPQTTRVHRVPRQTRSAHVDQDRLRLFGVVGAAGLFFQPFNHRTPRYTKNTLDATQTGPFLIGTENFFASFGRIPRELRMLAALAAAGAAEVLLFAIWCHSIFDKGRLPTMTACWGLGMHVSSLSGVRFMTMIPCHSTPHHYRSHACSYHPLYYTHSPSE